MRKLIHPKKLHKVMKSLFYLLVGALLILWFLGYIVYSWGAEVHLFFILAVAILVAILYQDNKI